MNCLTTLLSRLGVSLMLLSSAWGAWANDLVVAVTPNSRPFSYTETTGELTGFNVELAQAMCARLNRRCQLKTLLFPAIVPEVAAGRVDVAFGNMLKTPEREKLVAFSVPIWRSTTSFVGKAGQTLAEPSQAMNGRRLCVISGSRQEGFISAFKPANGGALQAHPSNQAVIDALVAGACELGLIPTMQALPFLRSDAGRSFGFVGVPLAQDGLGGSVHVVLRPGDSALLKGVDDALLELIRDGTHEKITRRYFPFSIL